MYEDGVIGGCITVEGQGYTTSSGGHVLLPQYDFDNSLGVTLILWVKALGLSSSDGETYINFGDDTRYDGTIYIMQNPSEVYFQYHETRLTVPYLEEYTGKWVMYALICEADGEMKAYINGALVGEKNIDYNGQINTSLAALGRHWWYNNTTTSSRFIGSFDEVRIYNRALSIEEVRALYQEPLGDSAGGGGGGSSQ
ncbi:MAG: LamG domain-containing protein [Bacteroidaceae bacterium]|nr:LamG domain-containing protein [Bacteroidaceae bacterium]